MSIESRKGSHALHPLQNKAEFIALYERLLNALDADEAVYFADAVHPECQTKPSYGWVKAGSNPAVTTTAGRGRVNIHGAHNRYYPTQTQFADAVLRFFRETLPKDWKSFRDQVSDNFSVVTHDKFRVLG